MVLEGVVTGILNKYLGKYIEKLDSNNLSIGIWSGDAVLQDLELKKDALSELDLPIEVNWGYVGKLKLNIPWSSLYTKPVIIILEDVYILTGPIAEKPYDAEKEKQFAIKAKRRLLKQIEKANRKKNNEPKPKDVAEDSLLEKLTAQIVKNIQVTIRNVHIRYEDRITQPKSPFAAGITLHSVSAQTTDEFWLPKVVDASVAKIHKLLNLEHLSVYWNTGHRGGVLFNGSSNLKNLMKSSIQTSNYSSSCHEYILEPLSAVAQATIDQSSNVVENLPKVLVNVLQEVLGFALSESQFKGIMNTVDSFKTMLRNLPFREYRPLKPPLEDIKGWWKYAFTCIAETTIRPWSWERIKAHRELFKEYKNLFRKRLIKKYQNVKDTSKLDGKIKALENSLDVPSILIARQQAENEYVVYLNNAESSSSDSEDENVAAEKETGWWSWLGFRGTTTEVEDDKDDDEDEQELVEKFSLSALSDEEKSKLYDAIGYSEEAGNPVYPKEYVKYKVDFTLKSCRVDLRSNSGRDIVSLTLSELLMAFKQRPGSKGFSLETSVTNLAVLGSEDVTKSIATSIDRPWIMKTSEIGEDDEARNCLLQFAFSMNPTDVAADYSVVFLLKPLKATYHMQTVKSVQAFFEMPETEAMAQLEQAVSERLTELSEATRAGVEYAVMQNRSTFINAEIKSPVIVVPYNELLGRTSGSDKILSVGLGDLHVVTDPNTELPDHLLREATESDLESMFYNKTTVTLSNTSVAVTTSGSSENEESAVDFILPPTTIELQISRSLKRGYTNFPDFKILTELKVLSLNLSEEKIEELIKVISYFQSWQYTEITSQENTISASTYSKGRAPSTTLSVSDLKELQIILSESGKDAGGSKRTKPPEPKDINDVASDATSEGTPWFDAEEDVDGAAPPKPAELKKCAPYESEMSLYDRTKLTCKVVLGQISLNYMTIENEKQKLYLWWNIQSCCINIEDHLWDMAIDFRIGSMVLQDQIHKDFSGNSLQIIDSPSDTDLISVKYVKATPKGPEFMTRFKQTEQSIKVNIAKLIVHGKEDSLVALSGVSARISQMFEENTMGPVPTGVRRRSLQPIQEESFSDSGDEDTKKEATDDEELPTLAKVLLEADVIIEDLTVMLSNLTSPVMKGSIMGLDFKFTQASERTDIVARQRIIEVTDLLQQGEEFKVLSAASSDTDLLFFKLVMFSKPRKLSSGGSMLPDINKKDMDVVAKLSKLKFVFLYALIDSCQNILSAVIEDKTRRQAQERAAMTVQNQVSSLHRQSERIALDINIAAPAIFVPVKRGSNDGFSIDLGHLSIENSFKYQELANLQETPIIDSMVLSLKDFIFYSSLSDKYENIFKPTPVNVNVRIDRSLSPWCTLIPVVDIHADLPKFKLGFGKKDINMLFQMLSENFGERPSESAVEIKFEGADEGREVEEAQITPSVISESTALSFVDLREDKEEPSTTSTTQVLAKCTVKIDEVMIILCDGLEDQHVYLTFEADHMSNKVEVDTSKTSISLNLEAVTFKDHTLEGTPLDVISSPVGKDLISISFKTGVDTSTDQPVNSQVFDISSSGLNVNIEKSSVAKLAMLLQDISDMSASLKDKVSEEPVIAQEEDDKSSNETISNFNVTATMEQLSIHFLQGQTLVAQSSVAGLAARVLVDSEKIIANCRLKMLQVDDLQQGSLYPKIFTVEDDNMLLVEFTMLTEAYKRAGATDQPDGVTEDGILKVEIGRVKAVFIFKFMMDIINFFDPLMKVFGSTPNQALEFGRQKSQLNAAKAVQYAQSLFKLILDMNIHAPLLLVPKTSQSNDLLLIDMGTLRITNHFDTFECPGSDNKNVRFVKDNIKPVLTSALVSRGRLNVVDRQMEEVAVVGRVDVATSIERFLHPVTPEIRIIVELPEVKVSLTESDLNLLSFVFVSNMAEGQAPEPVPKSTTDVIVPVDVVPVGAIPQAGESNLIVNPKPSLETPSQSMKIAVSLICNSAEVLVVSDGESEAPKLREGAKDLCSIKTENISVKVKVNTDSSIDVELAVLSMSGDDVRPSNNSFYKKVIEHKNRWVTTERDENESKDLISAKYKGLPNGEQSVDLVVQRAALFLNLEFVMKVTEFFTKAFVPMDAETTQSSNPTNEDNEQPLNFVLSGSIIDTDVLLLEDPNSAETHVIVAKISTSVYCKLNGPSIMANLDVKPFELVYSQFPNTAGKGRSLLRPCELKLLYSAPVKDTTGQDISVTLSEMTFYLSPSLLSTIIQIMETALGNQITGGDTSNGPAVKEDLFPWEEKPLNKDDLDENNEESGSAPAAIVSTGDQVDIRLELMELILGNDMKGIVVPLVTSKLSLRTRVMDWTSMLRVESDISIEASYFNDTLGAWEPLLEPNRINNETLPYEINLKLFTAETRKITFQAEEDIRPKLRKKRIFSKDEDATDGSGQAPMATYVIINSADTMQLTVTPKVIDITQQLIEGWNMEALRKSKDTMLQSALHIENQLGLPVTVWVKPDSQVSGHDGKKLFIKHYENVQRTESKVRRATDTVALFGSNVKQGKGRERRNLSYSGATSVSSKAKAERTIGDPESEENVWTHCGDHTDCITIIVKGFKPLKHISIQCAGKWLYPLMPEKSFFVSYLICQVDVHLGKKTVLLRSPLQVKNSLPISIQVWHVDVSSADATDADEIEEGDTAQIPPGSTLSFPLDRIFETYFFIQPEGYQKSVKYVTWRKLKDKDRMTLECSPKNRNSSAPYYITVHSMYDTFDKEPPEFVPKHVIELLPSLRIHNFLTSDLILTFKSGTTEFQQEFQPGHVAEVVHFQGKGECEMALEMTNYKGRKWTGNCTIARDETTSFPVTLRSGEEENSDFVTLEVAKHFEKCMDVWIYAGFWLLNKTGIPLEVKIAGRKGIYKQGASEETPLIVAYDDATKTKASLRIRGGTWTKFFSLNAVGDESSVVCNDSADVSYEIHINIQLSRTGRTKIITCSPKYLITNNTKHQLSYLEKDTRVSLWRILQPDSCNPFWPQTNKRLMYLKASDESSSSQVFPFGYNNKAVLRLTGNMTVSMQVSYVGRRIIINVKDYEAGMAPVRIDNYCEDLNVDIFQRNVGTRKNVNKLSSLLYTWDDLVKPRTLMWSLAGYSNGPYKAEIFVDGWGRTKIGSPASVSDGNDGKESSVSCINICRSRCCSKAKPSVEESRYLLETASPEPCDDVDGARRIFWISHLDGRQRVLSFTDNITLARKLRKVGDEEELVMDVFVSLHGVGISLVDAVPKEILYISLASGTSVWQVETGPETVTTLDVDISMFLEEAFENSVDDAKFEDKIEADLESMEMHKPLKGRLIRSCDPAVWVQCCTSANNMSVHIKLHRLQIDNQQYNVIYLTSLYPTPLSPRVIKRTGVKPFLEFSVIKSEVADVTVLKYLKLLLQEFNFKIDKTLLMGILGFYYKDITELDELTLYEEDSKFMVSTLLESTGNVVQSYSPPMVIEYFHLSPIKMHLAFSLQGGAYTDSPEGVLLEWLINTVGVHFTDVSDAEIRLAFFQRKSIYMTQDELLSDVIKHYQLQAVKQFHVIVLGLDVLGNPYGLVTDIGQGFKDLFYEPYRGVVGGPHEFAEGLAYGVRSLLGHTIGGTFNAAAMITDHLGQAVAALSFDTDYQRRRRAKMREDPSGIGEGLAIGGKNLVMGIVFGISGLFTKPVEGARRGGFEGFFKGVGKGLIGVLVKPTGGAIDLITSTFDGVRRFAEQSGEDNPCRMRLPRLTYPKKILEPYSKFKAEGYGLLRAIEHVEDQSEFYEYHLFVADENDANGAVIILTDKRMIKAYKTRFFDEWKRTWSDNYADIEDISCEGSIVRITIKDDLLSSPGEPDAVHEINCQSEKLAEKLYEKLTSLSHDCQTHLD